MLTQLGAVHKTVDGAQQMIKQDIVFEDSSNRLSCITRRSPIMTRLLP
jgi:hypothetical protein